MKETHESFTDEDLAQKSLENIDFFEMLMERHEKKLLRYIMRISSFASQDAEEILQEVFIKAWKNLNAFDEKLSFSSWIYRITHNETISTYRKFSSRGLDTQESIDHHVFHLKDQKADVHELLEQEQDDEKVRNAVSDLPQKYRDVLILYYFEDKSYAEIADVLKKPEGSIATLLHRSKKKYKKILESTII